MAARKQTTTTKTIAGYEVEVTRKRMKYLRLKVSPPGGAVSVSAPFAASNREIESLVTSRHAWIAEQQTYFRSLPKAKVATYESGEQHRLWGQQLTLEHITGTGRARVVQTGEFLLLINAHNKTTAERAKLLDAFYRTQLTTELPKLSHKWQAVTQQSATFWGIKKMKTRWGSCNITRKRIWLSLELAKYPLGCLEYVIVHELTHLLETNHTRRFYRLVEGFMPNWRQWEKALSRDSAQYEL